MSAKSEQETILRWDQEEKILHLYTAYPPTATKWRRLGYAVAVAGTYKGEPTGWQATGPMGAVRVRKVRNGQLVKKRTGRGNLPQNRHNIVAPETPLAAEPTL